MEQGSLFPTADLPPQSKKMVTMNSPEAQPPEGAQIEQPDWLHQLGIVDVDNEDVEVLEARLKKVQALISLKRAIERAENSEEYTALSQNPLFEEAHTAKGIELITEETALKTKIEAFSVVEDAV